MRRSSNGKSNDQVDSDFFSVAKDEWSFTAAPAPANMNAEQKALKINEKFARTVHDESRCFANTTTTRLQAVRHMDLRFVTATSTGEAVSPVPGAKAQFFSFEAPPPRSIPTLKTVDESISSIAPTNGAGPRQVQRMQSRLHIVFPGAVNYSAACCVLFAELRAKDGMPPAESRFTTSSCLGLRQIPIRLAPPSNAVMNVKMELLTSAGFGINRQVR